MEPWVGQDGSGEQGLFQLAESLHCGIIFFHPGNRFLPFPLSVLNQRGCNGGIPRNEAPIIPTLAQEGPQCLDVFRDRPLSDNSGVICRDLDAPSAHFMPQILDVVPEKLCFCRGDLQARSPEGSQDFPEDTEVLPWVLRMDRSIVQVTQNF